VAIARKADSPAVAHAASDPKVDAAWRHDNIGRLLSNALRHFEARVIELLIEAGHGEVSQSHINATRHLDVNGTRLTEMAQRAAMTKQSMGELVDQLEQKGLVVRRPDPMDGRARLVHFTPAGLAWLDDFRVAVKKAEREMARALGAEALQAVKDVLRHYDASTG
jgi:DNA-binding MarR family transcriptional regulator